MRDLIYDQKPEIDRLHQEIQNKILWLRNMAESQGVYSPYWGYAGSAVQTAIRVYEYELLRKGLARDRVPFEEDE